MRVGDDDDGDDNDIFKFQKFATQLLRSLPTYGRGSCSVKEELSGVYILLATKKLPFLNLILNFFVFQYFILTVLQQ